MVWTNLSIITLVLTVRKSQEVAGVESIKAAKCHPSEVYVQLQITPDEFPRDTSWKIYNDKDGSIVRQKIEGFLVNETNYTTTECLPQACYRFTILDVFGDGIIEPGGCVIKTHKNAEKIQSDFGYHSTSTSFGFCDSVNSSSFVNFESLYRNGTYQFEPMIGNDLNQTYYGRNAHRVTRKGLDNVKDEIIKYHIPIFADITISDDNANSECNTLNDGVEGAMLAIKHWNEMNSVVVEELNSVNCPIRFSTEVIDTQSSISETLQKWTEIISRDPFNYTHPQPSIILDVSALDNITSKLYSSTSAYDILHVSSTSITPTFDLETYTSSNSKSFTRTNPTHKETAESLASYLANVQNVTHCGIIYNPDDLRGGALFYRTLQEKGSSLGLRILGVPIRGEPFQSPENITEALKGLNDLNLIIAALPSNDKYIANLLKSASHNKLLRSEKRWIFGGDFARALDDWAFLQDYPFSSDLHDNFVFRSIGMFDVYRDQDSFLHEWRNSFNQRSSVKKTKEDLSVARYSYDAVISMGLASCQAWSESSNGISSSGGSILHQKITNQTFKGASGLSEVGVESFSRNATSTFYALMRIKSIALSTQNKTQGYTTEILHYFNPFHSSWLNGNQSLTNTTTAEKRLKKNQSQKLDLNLFHGVDRFDSMGKNELGKVIRIICLSLCSILLFSAVVFSFYVIMNRDHPTVKESLPFYLILNAGVILMCSAVTIPFYEYQSEMMPEDKQTKKVACTSFPCLMILGFSLLMTALLGILQNIKKVSIALEEVSIFSNKNFNAILLLPVS